MGDKSADKEKWKLCGKDQHELQLYSAIARRIEVALESLEAESKRDNDAFVRKAYKKMLKICNDDGRKSNNN